MKLHERLQKLRQAYNTAMEGRTTNRAYRVGNDEGPDEENAYYVYVQSPKGYRNTVCGSDLGLYKEDAQFIAACYTHIGAILLEKEKLNELC